VWAIVVWEGRADTEDADDDEDVSGVEVTTVEVFVVLKGTLEVEELLLVEVPCDRRRLGWYLYSKFSK